jgi:hypothetical protein
MPNLTDLATVRQAIPRLASVADAEVTRLIGEASDIIETYCKRAFGSASHTELYNNDGSGHIFVKNRPIISITSITTGLPNYGTVIDSSTYQFEANTGEIRPTATAGYFPYDIFNFGWVTGPLSGFQSIQVVYTSGYSTVPPLIVGRCLAILNRAAAGLNNDPNTKSMSAGERSITYANLPMAMNDEDRRVLCQGGYRTWSM